MRLKNGNRRFIERKKRTKREREREREEKSKKMANTTSNLSGSTSFKSQLRLVRQAGHFLRRTPSLLLPTPGVAAGGVGVENASAAEVHAAKCRRSSTFYLHLPTPTSASASASADTYRRIASPPYRAAAADQLIGDDETSGCESGRRLPSFTGFFSRCLLKTSSDWLLHTTGDCCPVFT